MSSTTDEKKRAKNRKYYLKHKEKIITRQREQYRNNPERKRASYREYYQDNLDEVRAKARKKSRVTRDQHARAARARDVRRRIKLIGRPMPSVCDICGDTGRWLCADHCHKSGHGRGWLCDRCNLVLGKVGDDCDLLRKMIAYLVHHAAYQSPQLTLPGF